jgi:hypothetical protein
LQGGHSEIAKNTPEFLAGSSRDRRRVAKAMGVPALLLKGVPIDIVSKLLAHSSITVTARH